MNVIVTARSATLYSQEEFMKILGTKPDGPKDLPYMFDVVLELTKTMRDGKEVFIARTEKIEQILYPLYLILHINHL